MWDHNKDSNLGLQKSDSHIHRAYLGAQFKKKRKKEKPLIFFFLSFFDGWKVS